MKLIARMVYCAGLAAALVSCADKAAEFKYLVDEFADLKIMRYQVRLGYLVCPPFFLKVSG